MPAALIVLHGFFEGDGCRQLKGREGIDAYLASRNAALVWEATFCTI
jgi:hypothetical protein